MWAWKRVQTARKGNLEGVLSIKCGPAGVNDISSKVFHCRFPWKRCADSAFLLLKFAGPTPYSRSLVFRFRLATDGRVAQLGERLVRNEEAAGSIPATSTIHLTATEEHSEVP
jgi:hypothetical protein